MQLTLIPLWLLSLFAEILFLLVSFFILVWREDSGLVSPKKIAYSGFLKRLNFQARLFLYNTSFYWAFFGFVLNVLFLNDHGAVLFNQENAGLFRSNRE